MLEEKQEEIVVSRTRWKLISVFRLCQVLILILVGAGKEKGPWRAVSDRRDVTHGPGRASGTQSITISGTAREVLAHSAHACPLNLWYVWHPRAALNRAL
jgi:hypothetical protein